MVFEVKNSIHLRKLWYLIGSLILVVFLWSTLDFRLSYDVFIIVTPFILLNIPNVYMHVNHYLFCKHKKIIFEDDYLLFEDINQGIEKIALVDMKRALCVMSPNKKVGIVSKFPFDQYFYIRLERLDGTLFYLSSLYTDQLNEVFERFYPDLNLQYKSTFYPNINPFIIE